MELMKNMPDNSIDLAIVDPPYGSGGGEWSSGTRFGERFDRYKNKPGGGGMASRNTASVHRQKKNCKKPDGTWGYPKWKNQEVDKKIIEWDVAPQKEYFNELFRISRNQIIWGGNYFELPPCRCFLIWRKLTISESFSMAMCEYAWTSFNTNAKVYECVPQDATGKRFHPTQKPVSLYEWQINMLANDGDVILDTHAGSASSLVACHNTGHRFIASEIDKYYYQKAVERLETETAQANIYQFINPDGI